MSSVMSSLIGNQTISNMPDPYLRQHLYNNPDPTATEHGGTGTKCLVFHTDAWGGGRGIISRSVRMVAVVQVMVGLSQLLWGFGVGLVIEGQKFPSRAQESALTFCLSVTEVNPSRTECSSVSPASSACHLSGTLSFSLEV